MYLCEAGIRSESCILVVVVVLCRLVSSFRPWNPGENNASGLLARTEPLAGRGGRRVACVHPLDCGYPNINTPWPGCSPYRGSIGGLLLRNPTTPLFVQGGGRRADMSAQGTRLR